MQQYAGKSFVTTVKDRCRTCYTCVRECPAKAIRIVEGQAEIIGERCINCGNCVKVCSQNAKQVISNIDFVRDLLGSETHVAACIAPSFPAEFDEVKPEELVGMIRALGFDSVHEVALGADLVADRYRRLLGDNDGQRYIASTCPAIITYMEKYVPDRLDSLAPIVSPMVATARVLRQEYDNLHIVFIGPCIAKKQESVSDMVACNVDISITFIEFRTMLEEAGISTKTATPSDFDPPHAGYGSLFSISRGLLQAADIPEDLMRGEIVSADGRSDFVEAIKEFDTGELDAQLLEVLCCNGCIMGAGISSKAPLFSRRSRVSKYVRDYIAKRDPDEHKRFMERYKDLDLSRSFRAKDQRIPVPSQNELEQILARMGKFTAHDELNCGACGYETCRDHAIAIFKGLAENEMCLPYTIEQLKVTVKDLAVSNEQLSQAQEALAHTEKLANMGQIAAGIAHEVNNPLGVVLMYAHILLDEFNDDPRLTEDLCMITEQADRCKKIVAGLLGFARQHKVTLEPSDMHELAESSLATVQIPESVQVKRWYTDGDFTAEVDRDQIIQVLTNLISNAVGAMPDGGTLTVETNSNEKNIYITILDTGVGIPPENRDKIFEPFFTTKQIGKGTGLGLSVTYGIVKMHYGDIKVDSNVESEEGETGTAFTIRLPRHGKVTNISN